MGMVAYLGDDHQMFKKTDTTCQQINLGMVAYLGAVLMIIAFMILYVGTRYCHHIFMCHKFHVKHTLKQCNLNRLKSGSKRGTNDTPTCVCLNTPHRRTLFGEGRRGVQPRFCVYFAKACGGWVCAGVNGVV